jgi:hypothetical protein
MRRTIGRDARAMHLLLTSALALPGAGILLVALLAIPGDTEQRWLLVVIFGAPIWLVGIVAAIEAIRVARGRPVSARRAAAFALVGVVGGTVLAWTQGVFAFLGTLVDRPGDVDLGWPISIIRTRDGTGADYVHLDAAGIWVAVAWVILGVASLLALARDHRGGHAG